MKNLLSLLFICIATGCWAQSFKGFSNTIDLSKATIIPFESNINIDGDVYYKDEKGNLVALFDTQLDLYFKDGNNNEIHRQEHTIDLEINSYREQPKATILLNAASEKMPKDKRVRIEISHPGYETIIKTRKPTPEPLPDGRIKMAIHLGNIVMKPTKVK